MRHLAILRNPHKILWAVALGASLLSMALTAEEPNSAKRSVAEINVGTTRIDWVPSMDSEQSTLTVAGPKDFYIRQEFEPGEFPSFSLFDSSGHPLPDGDYTYELRLTLSSGEQPRIQAGSFAVRKGGFTAAFEERKTTEPQTRNAPASPEVIHDKLITSENECIGSLCEAGDDEFSVLRLKDYYNVGILFEDVFDGFSYFRDWLLQANPNLGGPDYFFLQDLDAATVPFSVYGNSPDYSLVVGTGGKIGMGTAIPGAPLHLYSSATGDAFAGMGPDPVSGPAFNLGYGGASFGRGAGFLNVRPDASATAPNPSLRFLTANTERMIITNTGSVGIGTTSPTNNLHVKVATAGNGILIDGDQTTDVAVNLRAHGNSAGVLLNDLQGGANQRIVQQLLDNDALRIRGLSDALTETVDGIVLSLSSGNVGVNCESAPGADLVVDDGGACNSGTRSELNAGSIQFTVPSSRSLKENLAPVEVEGILDRIRQVKVYSYDFINGPKDRIGLIAEDFHAIFGRGSDKTISGDEIQLALWLAIQELTAVNKELRDQNMEIRKRLADLEAHLAVAPLSEAQPATSSLVR